MLCCSLLSLIVLTTVAGQLLTADSVYCQAQLSPSSSPCWLAELALISINPATPPPPPHPGKVYLVAEANKLSTGEYSKNHVHDLASLA